MSKPSTYIAVPIGTIFKTNGDEVRVSIVESKHDVALEIRIFAQFPTREMHPTTQGVRIPLTYLSELQRILGKAEAELLREGLPDEVEAYLDDWNMESEGGW